MSSNSLRRKGRSQWRFILGLSVLGLLIIASASHAASVHTSVTTGAPADASDSRGVQGLACPPASG